MLTNTLLSELEEKKITLSQLSNRITEYMERWGDAELDFDGGCLYVVVEDNKRVMIINQNETKGQIERYKQMEE